MKRKQCQNCLSHKNNVSSAIFEYGALAVTLNLCDECYVTIIKDEV